MHVHSTYSRAGAALPPLVLDPSLILDPTIYNHNHRGTAVAVAVLVLVLVLEGPASQSASPCSGDSRSHSLECITR